MMNDLYKKISIFAVSLVLFLPLYVSAHGYIQSPSSRAYLCQQQLNSGCGEVQYEPQSIEGQKGFPEKGPPDGHIASAGKPQYYQLDEQTSVRWKKIYIINGAATFTWTLTAEHATQSWDYFITKAQWDNNKPLTRADFEEKPFCHFNGDNKPPHSPVKQVCEIPKDRKGYNIILGVWSIADTDNAFYQAVDVVIQ